MHTMEFQTYEPRSAPELSVIVPAYNERRNVPLMVKRLRVALAGIDWEAIFVDDNSPDGTADAVRAIGQNDNRVRCIRIGRRGLAGACLESMLASQARSSRLSMAICNTTKICSPRCSRRFCGALA